MRRRLTAFVLAVVAAGGVVQAVGAAHAARGRWSDVRDVVVTTQDLRAGHDIGDRDVTITSLPASAVPDDALATLPPDATAAIRTARGTVLTDSLLLDDRRSATARALRSGRVGIAVRTGDLPNLADEGDRVDVAAPGWEEPVALDATVLAVSGHATTLAVRDSDAAATAAASLSGPVALLVRP